MKKIISTSEAPAAIGPYSQGVRVGSTIYYSGQIPLDPKTGQVVSGGIDVQTRRVMENIGGFLQGERLGYDKLLKKTNFFASMGGFSTPKQIYRPLFQKTPPPPSAPPARVPPP